ncbi:MAG: hypothetical protein K0R54_559 [Clostridiaceae bacterium]|jgi:hypothetical protein|nr:hypothetical protein [Clostridiaceae bacterium]
MCSDIELVDFKEVHELFLVESLTNEDIEDGLEPMEIELKVGYTKHAIERMFNSYGRQCEFEDVENLIIKKTDSIMTIKNNEEFALVNENQTLVLVCEMIQKDGMTILSIITVIRKVFVDKNFNEHEKKVWLNKETKAY